MDDVFSRARARIRARSAAVIAEDGNILLVQHEKGGGRYWVLPGGTLEYGETLEAAARREVLEETGLEIEIQGFLFVQESIPRDLSRHVINVYFHARVTGGELTMGPDDVMTDVRWIPLGELPRLTVYPDVTAEILDWIRTGRAPAGYLGNRWSAP